MYAIFFWRFGLMICWTSDKYLNYTCFLDCISSVYGCNCVHNGEYAYNIVIICSGGGLVAATNGRSRYHSAYADAGQQDGDCKKKKVVVLGTGWAGTSFLKNLKSSSYDVHVISPHNYFAFTPLLPSVTCGTVEARSIVEPIRSITRKVVSLFPFKIES